MVCAVRSEPITATPRALPTWRTVVFDPLATPELSGGISDSTTLVSWARAKPDADAVQREARAAAARNVIDGETTQTISMTPRRRPSARCAPPRRAEDADEATADLGARR